MAGTVSPVRPPAGQPVEVCCPCAWAYAAVAGPDFAVGRFVTMSGLLLSFQFSWFCAGPRYTIPPMLRPATIEVAPGSIHRTELMRVVSACLLGLVAGLWAVLFLVSVLRCGVSVDVLLEIAALRSRGAGSLSVLFCAFFFHPWNIRKMFKLPPVLCSLREAMACRSC